MLHNRNVKNLLQLRPPCEDYTTCLKATIAGYFDPQNTVGHIKVFEKFPSTLEGNHATHHLVFQPNQSVIMHLQ